jgi:pimeloyl-ACP methyl ester carboxylesterase
MANLFFTESGNGQAVVLLHGFPFHQEIWKPFARKLSETLHVYTVDLPGFGKSPMLNAPFTVDQVGESIIYWTIERKIEKPILIGHSLGGYVALAAIKKNPDLFSGLVLFHSTAYADTEEKKESRNKVLEFINKNGVETFTSNFISTLFANQHHPGISTARSIAIDATAESVKGYTQAMRDRTERTDILRSYNKPILFLAGKKDQGLSVESIRKQAALCLHSHVHVMPEVAHMGMLENEDESLEIIRTFIHKSIVTSKFRTV